MHLFDGLSLNSLFRHSMIFTKPVEIGYEGTGRTGFGLSLKFVYLWIWIRLQNSLSLDLDSDLSGPQYNRIYIDCVGFESGFGFKAVGFGFGFKKNEVDSDSYGFGFKTPGFGSGFGFEMPGFAHHWCIRTGGPKNLDAQVHLEYQGMFVSSEGMGNMQKYEIWDGLYFF